MALNHRDTTNMVATKAPQPPATNGGLSDSSGIPGGPVVNKKKQKRRQKEAQRAAAQQQGPADASGGGNPPLSNGGSRRELASPSYDEPNTTLDRRGRDSADYAYSDEQDNSYDYEPEYQNANGLEYGRNPKTGKNKKKRDLQSAPLPLQSSRPFAQTRQPTISSEALRTVQRKMQNSIWDTNSTKERAAIKEFWIGLSEQARKELVNIEKSHVLQKMKEQQKHSCSCTVCGRKRTAIEEELEILYVSLHELRISLPREDIDLQLT